VSTVARGRRNRTWLAAIVALGLVVRLLFFWLVQPTDAVGEEVPYLSRSLSGTANVFSDDRPPVMAAVLRLSFRLFGPTAAVARLSMVLAGTMIIPLVYLLAARLAGARTGLVAALVAALYPNLVFLSCSLWTDLLYLVFLLGGFTCLAAFDRGSSSVVLVPAGVLLAVAVLTRDVGMAFALAAAVWILFHRAPGARFPRWGAASLYLGFFALALLPWVVHVNRGKEDFVLVTRGTYLKLYAGNRQFPEDTVGHARGIQKSMAEYGKLGRTGPEREAKARELVFAMIRERMPWWPFEKIATELPNLFTPNSFPAARLLAHQAQRKWPGEWAYRFRTKTLDDGGLRRVLAGAAVGGYVIVAVLGAAGVMLLVRGRGPVSLVALYAALHVAPTVVAFACSRYRLPVVVLLIIGLAALLVDGKALWSRAGRGRKTAALASATILALLIAARWSTVLSPQWG
jgi:4-amino-4-deoxy-L-arabinose transferase-like glycosyltransferase